MSTSLSTMGNQARKRVGFKADTDELPNDGDRILDEQGTVNSWHPHSLGSGSPADLQPGSLEQDEVIDDIRHQMAKSDRETRVGTGIVALSSCVLYASLRPPSFMPAYTRVRHVMYLFNPVRPPTAVLFKTPDRDSPIPLDTMFSCLHLCLQGYLCVSLFHPPTDRKIRAYVSSVWSNGRVPIGYNPPVDPHLYPLLISSIAPSLCIILRKGWANFTWWCFCGILFSIHSFAQRGRLHDEARIEGLEKLKYHAKGA